ncbi:MAG: UDP-glucose/GDP-mannose dehydrogenase family protein [Porticoccaceae bacterium]|jgi:UDPglucose 6-dehydrogenase|nr:UDP-glucose/GDP-mannose dehydrogenase family protein [Porticoccaceae bacterium]MBT7259403.1 UDP-glucose/GDP-mannose dehydrogenase family protein [Porticoccaceae bacterium]MDA9565752.1 UDP-glucose/GDP-mannose dehydrogenase family protein [Porticoccaceae bacterium]MDB2554223.1 UDP-glucose/GDP-mannose dehydrogenase family protein [Porticoccaceae bacterium]
MRITIFGSGYVGLVTGACFANVGNQVVCVDIDQAKVDALNNGQIPIYEPGLDSYISQSLADGSLSFTTDAAAAVAHGEMIFIAVGTPPEEDGSADLQYVLQVADTIGQFMDDFKVVVNKSTVPVGTADKVSDRLQQALDQRGLDLGFDVASNPEFLKEGAAIADFTRPDRIVVGTDSTEVEVMMQELYAPYNRQRDKLIFMDLRSAELTKYAANSLLATKISFINEIANIADLVGADIEQVRVGIGSDPRIGYSFIYPGCGFGGSCFPKDLRAMEATAVSAGYLPKLLSAVSAVNDQQKSLLFKKIDSYFDGQLEGKTIALWGLAFKPGTDDMREAPSRDLMEALWQRGAKVQAFDPHGMEATQEIYGVRNDLLLCGTKEAALQGADILAICTEWKPFWSPDFALIKDSLKQPVIFDGRNLYDPARLQDQGIQYFGMGRSNRVAPSATACD